MFLWSSFYVSIKKKKSQNPNMVSIWICTAKLQLETFKTIKKPSKNIHDMKESMHCYVIDIWVKLYYQLAVMDRWRKTFLKTLNRNFLHLLLSFGYWNTSRSMLRKRKLSRHQAEPFKDITFDCKANIWPLDWKRGTLKKNFISFFVSCQYVTVMLGSFLKRNEIKTSTIA